MQTYAAHKKPKTLKVILTFTYWNSCARFSTIGRRFQMPSFQMKRPQSSRNTSIHAAASQMRKMMKLPIKQPSARPAAAALPASPLPPCIESEMLPQSSKLLFCNFFWLAVRCFPIWKSISNSFSIVISHTTASENWKDWDITSMCVAIALHD